MRRIICGTALLCLMLGTAGIANAGLFGPPKYQVQHSIDKFSANPTPITFGQYNLLSRKQPGYVLAMGDGFFIDPVVILVDGQKVLSLRIKNDCTSHQRGGKWVCVGRPGQLDFITGEGQPINLMISDGKAEIGDATYNSVSRDTSVAISETGYADLTQEQYERIMNAPDIAVKISGSDKSIVFEGRAIDDRFQANLKSFYTDYVVGNKSD